MLRLEIDGDWEPQDFIEVLAGIESLYYKAALGPRRLHGPDYYFLSRGGPYSSFDDRLQGMNRWLLEEARLRASGAERIHVKAIIYASPGSVDLIGLGKTMEALERAVGRLVDFFEGRRKRIEGDKQATLATAIKEIAVEKERESLRAIQIENAKEILALRREYRDELDEILIPLIVEDQDKLVSRIAEGKLIGVKRIEGDSKPKQK